MSSIFNGIVTEVEEKTNKFLIEEILINQSPLKTTYDEAFVKMAEAVILAESVGREKFDENSIFFLVVQKYHQDFESEEKSNLFFDFDVILSGFGKVDKPTMSTSALLLKGFLLLNLLDRYLMHVSLSNRRFYYLVTQVRELFTEYLKNEERDPALDYVVYWGIGLCTYLQGKRVKVSQQNGLAIEKMKGMFSVAYSFMAKSYYQQQLLRKPINQQFWYLGHLMISPYYIANLCLLMENIDSCRSWILRGYVDRTLPPDYILAKSDLIDHMKNIYLTKKFLHQNSLFETSQVLESGGSYEDLSQSIIFRNTLQTSTFSTLTSNDHPLNILKPFFRQTSQTKQRLHSRMELYGVEPRRDIPGDGNCQFYSLSDQLTGTLNYASYIRYCVVIWLKAHADYQLSNGATLRDFVHDKTWENYIQDMSRNSVWGDHLTLLAAAELFQSKVFIISSVPGDNYVVEIVPENSIPRRTIMISHEAEYHYGSVKHTSVHLRNPLLKE